MGWILEQGIEIILWLQSFGPSWVGVMAFLSFLGLEPFFLLVAPALLWCVDPGWGLRLGLGLTLSNSLNGIFKLWAHGPRPYWFDARVQPFSAESSFGAPSGHAQNAVVVWGLLAVWINRLWMWIAAITIMFLIGLSRMYLGVHFPHDVIAGWLLGALILILMLRTERLLKPWIDRSRPAAVIAAAFAFSVGLILVAGLLRFAAQNWTLPDAWMALAGRITGADPIEPFRLSGVISSAAAFFGIAAGGVLLKHHGWLDPAGVLWKRLLRYVIGIVGLLALYLGLDLFFPDGDNLVGAAFRFVRYALVGLWLSYGAPETFIGLGIAGRPAVAAQPSLSDQE